MPNFKSINGEWFPQDEVTKNELKEHGLDHLGIHVSEDPYIKNLEFVTGISRKELVGHQQQAMLNQMQSQMLKTQQALTLALLGDKDGAKDVIANIKQESVVDEKKEDSLTIDDKKQLAEDEFKATTNPKRAKTKYDTSNLPKEADNKPTKHEPVEVPSALAQGVTGEVKAKAKKTR